MDFETDVFVSYAHIDDQALAEGQKGWISSFHRALEVRLGQLLGKTPRIFRDPKLSGNDCFEDRLVERLPRSALLVSVLSPRYVRSDWCTRELREFLLASERTGGWRVADKARVFKVVKTPIPLEQHPAELQKVLGYEFFTVEPQTGRPRELSQLAEPDAQRQYWARLDDLAHDISELLELLAATGSRAAVAGAERGFVYLAETTFEMQEKRDAVKREIQGQGFAVLPDRPLPLLAAECAAVARADLARCLLSVHLVGRSYGIVPEGTAESLVSLQNELAVERASHGGTDGFTRLLWLPPDLAPEDERQRRFLDHLRTDPRLGNGADLLETPFEDFKATLARRLAPPPPPRASATTGGRAAARTGGGAEEGDVRRVYLLCDQRDLAAIGPLESHLFDQGIEVVTPVFEGDEAQVRRDHEENLVLCDAALVYYGAGSELWLRQKLRELQKSAGYGRTAPLAAKAIYVAPPDGEAKRRLRTHEALVLTPEGAAFAPETLEPFLRLLHPPHPPQ
ncbi:MAG TPA: hypothetical protein VFE33_09170 [Thermoanaerobaculia bacterium]|nr:hypothetical protein [Thermoanaerobaculia bacterium]